MTGFDLAFTSIIVFGTTVGVLLGMIWILQKAAQKLDDDGKRTARFVSFILIGWAAFSISYGAFVGMTFLTLPFLAGVPILTGSLLSFTNRGKQLLSAIDLHHIIALQSYRIAGFIFLYLYYVPGTLTRGFALNAGIGDMLTGLLAVPVAWLVRKKIKGYEYFVVAWCLFGAGDLINAGISARLYGPAQLVDFPINAVPLYLGPPLGILLHICTLRILWLKSKQPLVLASDAA